MQHSRWTTRILLGLFLATGLIAVMPKLTQAAFLGLNGKTALAALTGGSDSNSITVANEDNGPSPTPSPSPTPTPTATPPPAPTGNTLTLQVTDGWDLKNGKTLASTQKVYLAQRSDNARLDLESGYLLSFQFQNNIPADATIESVKVYVEHYEEEGISPNSVEFEIGGGALKTPTIVANKAMPVLAGESKEQTVEWDVTSAINTAAKANDLKVVVRNKGTNGKKIKIDRVYLVVTYSGGTSTITPTPTPTPTPQPGSGQGDDGSKPGSEQGDDSSKPGSEQGDDTQTGGS